MTVSSSTNRNQYTGNGATTSFARTFLVSDVDHLKVYTTTGGVTTEVTSGVTKTDGIGTASGNVVFDTAPASGTTVTLIREVPLTQETDYSAQGSVSPEQVEADFDLAGQIVQDLQEELGRASKGPVSSSLSNLDLPTPVGGAAIGWASGGGALVNITTLSGDVPVSGGPDNAVMRYDNGAAGLQDSGVFIDDSDNVTGVNDMTVNGDLTVTGTLTGGSFGTASALDEATSAQWRANTADKVLSTDQVWGAMGEVSLSDGATIALDLSTGFDFTVTLGGNRLLSNPTNAKVGQRGRIRVVQDGTGSRTLSFGTSYEFAGGTAPTLTTTAAAEDVLYYDVISSTRVLVTAVLDVS